MSGFGKIHAPSLKEICVQQILSKILSGELKTGDRLEIGEGIYMFVPLCGENFEW